MKEKNIKVAIKGTEGSKLLDNLNYLKSDELIIKKRYSSFFKTNLLDIIKKNKITNLVISGVNTHACVRTTAIDAYQNDIKVIIAKDCVASYDIEHHNISINYFKNNMLMKILNNKQIKNILK